MATKDYYEVLGIPQTATPDVIKKEYHFLLHAWHPDKFPDPDQKARATQKTKELNEAYEVLTNPVKRAAYDKQRSSQAEASPPHTPPPSQSRPPSQGQRSSTASTETPQRSQRKAHEERHRRVEEA